MWKAWDQGDQPDAVPVETILEIVQENPKGIKHAKLAAAIADRGVYRATAYRRIKEAADAGLIKCKKETDLYMASDI
jgi:hypothetical protein